MTWYFGCDDKLGEIDIFAASMASNASFVAKLNAWKKAVKKSRHVTGSLRDELYL